MAPVNRSSTRIVARKPTISAENIIAGNSLSFSKRKAVSPPKKSDFKRPALNEITNDGKTAKVKSLVQSGKNNKSNIGTASKSNISETRSKFVTGVRIQGPFKGRSNVQPSHGSVPTNKTVKPLPRASITTRSSLVPKSNPSKSVKNLEKVDSVKATKSTSTEDLSIVEHAILLSKLKLRTSGLHDENVSKGPPLRRSLKNHIEKNEISVQSLIPMFESKTENQESDVKPRRSLRLAANAETEACVDEKSVKCEPESPVKLRRSLRNSAEKSQVDEKSVKCEPESPVKLRRSLRNSAEKAEVDEKSVKCEPESPVKLRRSLRSSAEKSEANKSHICDLDDKCHESELVIKLRRSIPDSIDNEVSFQVYVENQSTVEPKVLRRSSRLSVRKSLSSDKSTENGSLYVSALEDINTSFRELETDRRLKHYSQLSEFDKELLHDPQQVSLYAMEIFDYLKSRESHFTISDYMDGQPHIDRKMRAMLVDWLVEVQENFELNHETLYLSIKLLDSYLSHNEIKRESLQLLGAASLFLACKYDERLSPLTEEFEYVGDGAYDRNLLLSMEQNILRCVNYELSFPISYSFLRRYARCARIQMPLLTLARYILELGLMEYDTITLSDSKQAAAALYLAFRMAKYSKWTDSLRYYTGYDVEDFKDIVLLFNRILHQKPSSTLMTVKNKYSHELFYEVARTPLLSNKDLNLDV